MQKLTMIIKKLKPKTTQKQGNILIGYSLLW